MYRKIASDVNSFLLLLSFPKLLERYQIKMFMVKIAPIQPYLPKHPETFVTNPYDIIGTAEEAELKKYPESLIHLILPDGEGDEIYQNAKKALDHLRSTNTIQKALSPAIYVYRQESVEFSQQGFILGVSLQDYEEGNIVRHEHTRNKPLKDRTQHIATTHAATGLVWNVFSSDKAINAIMEEIKTKPPVFDFQKYTYRHLLWEETDPQVIGRLSKLFVPIQIFIADGHHRAASANEYRKMKLQQGAKTTDKKPWQNLLTYVASDDQVWILPYNRVIRKLPMSADEFLTQLADIYLVESAESPFNPTAQHEVAICLQGSWYKLVVKNRDFPSKRDSLDVAILQDRVLDPILGITDPRSDKNLFFVGNVKYYRNPSLMQTEFIEKQGNDLFINLFAVDIHDIEEIGGAGGVMPPKSTWFEPKVLSGLTILGLDE
jgi:uncharacterized protein (DUF1015 family)